jgi:pimeloyl-ACP methyl ester carboxylesterase
MASVNGIQLHYVIGGQGDPIVLLHGWPQTWYEWRAMSCQLWLRIIL